MSKSKRGDNEDLDGSGLNGGDTSPAFISVNGAHDSERSDAGSGQDSVYSDDEDGASVSGDWGDLLPEAQEIKSPLEEHGIPPIDLSGILPYSADNSSANNSVAAHEDAEEKSVSVPDLQSHSQRSNADQQVADANPSTEVSQSTWTKFLSCLCCYKS